MKFLSILESLPFIVRDFFCASIYRFGNLMRFWYVTWVRDFNCDILDYDTVLAVDWQ